MDRAVGRSDGYCSRIIRAQGTRKEGYNEFRLRVEGDPETYQPGSTYRGMPRELKPPYAHVLDVNTLYSNLTIIDVERRLFVTVCE